VKKETLAAGEGARGAAQDILSDVLRKRRPLDAATEDELAHAKLSPRDAGFARAISHETLRRFGQLDAAAHPVEEFRAMPSFQRRDRGAYR